MSLHPEPIGAIPADTLRVAHAAFPKGTLITRLRDEFSALYQDEHFRELYPTRGQPGLAPWRLALVTLFQFLETLSDRQAADAVRARIDWKYALGLELTDPGFHFSGLSEFRARLVAGGAEPLLLDAMLERFKDRGLVKARGKQRTDSTHVLAAVHDLHLLERVAETLRAALDDLAAVVPDWLRTVAQPAWFERYGRRIEESRLPRSRTSTKPSPSWSARTGSACWTPWTRRMRRTRLVRWRWCRRCGTCGGCTMRARRTGDPAGGRPWTCPRWASACSRPTIRRRTTA